MLLQFCLELSTPKSRPVCQDVLTQTKWGQDTQADLLNCAMLEASICFLDHACLQRRDFSTRKHSLRSARLSAKMDRHGRSYTSKNVAWHWSLALPIFVDICKQTLFVSRRSSGSAFSSGAGTKCFCFSSSGCRSGILAAAIRHVFCS